MIKLLASIYNCDKHQFQVRYNQVAVVVLPLVLSIVIKFKLTSSSYSIPNYLIIDIVNTILLLTLIQLIIIIITNFKYTNHQLVFKSLIVAIGIMTAIIVYRIISLTDVRTTLLAASDLSLTLSQINQILTINIFELIIAIVAIGLSPKYIFNKP